MRLSCVCKVFPEDAQWPSQSAWGTFNKLSGGALTKAMPFAAQEGNSTATDDAQCLPAATDRGLRAQPGQTILPVLRG